MIDMGDNREIAYKALQILTHVPKNRFIIVTASQVVKEIAPAYNPRAHWMLPRHASLDHRSNAARSFPAVTR